MNSNKDLYVKIISIVSLVVLGYIFFISVYNQIIVQSGGVFYIIIFSGILILAFVLLSLVTKLIEITGEIRDNIMWSFVEILLLCHLSYLFLVFRMAYKSTLPGEETVLYRAAALLKEGTFADKGMDMVQHLCIYPSEYLYAFILSVFFRIVGVKSSILIVLNAAAIILTAFLIDRVVRKIAGRACGIIAAMCTVFIPSQSFAVYSYSSEVLFCALLLLSIDLWLKLMETDGSDRKKRLIFSGVFGLSLAFLCFVEPLMLLCIIAFIVYFVIKHKDDGKEPMVMTAVAAAAFVLILLVLTFTKSVSLGTGFKDVVFGGLSRYKLSVNIDTSEDYTAGEVFKKFHENLDNQNTNVKDNYHFLVDDEGAAYTQTQNAWFSLGTQMSYMFVLVMSIACAFYMFRNKHKNALPVFVTLIACFFVLFFRSTDEDSTFFMFELLIITACCGLNYMYMNHHPELFSLVPDVPEASAEAAESASLSDGVMEWGSVAKARNLIFVKNDDQIPEGTMAGREESVPVQDVPSTPVSPGLEPAPMPVDSTPVPEEKPAEETDTMMGGSVSPEGYFSFFNLGPAPAPVNRVPEPIPEPEPVEEYAQETEEYTGLVEEYAEPVEEYAQEPEEYTELVEEYTEPVEEYTEQVEEYNDIVEEYGEYEEAADEYQEEDTGYMGGADYSASVDYEEPEYQESGYDDSAPLDTEYKGSSYEESAYEEPGYEEPEYEETEYGDGGYESGYDEPSFDDLVAEYGQEEGHSSGFDQESVYTAPASPVRTPGGTTKASFTSAAHALGFSLSDDFFTNAGQPEEPVYEEPAYEEPVYEEQQGYEESPAPIQDFAEDTYEEEPVYDPSYDSGIDEFSFGEGMPDISMFNEPAPAPAPAPAPKKKIIKKKVVRRVVKKAPAQPLPTMDFRDDLSALKEQFEPREDLPTLQFKTDLSSIEEAFSYEGDYVDDDAIYDEPDDGNFGQGFTIEI